MARWKWTCLDCGAVGTFDNDDFLSTPHDCRSKGPFDLVSELLVEPA